MNEDELRLRTAKKKKSRRSLSYNDLQKRYRQMKLMEKEAEIRDRIIETNNQWNSELEYIAASIGEKCIGFKWMHAQCATFYSFCYHIIGLVVILVTAGAATGTVTQISNCSVDPLTGRTATYWVLVLTSVLMYVSSVMLSIQQFKNWGGVQKEHKQFHSNYSSLEHRIRVHLGIYRKARIIGKDYVEMISSEFDNLEASSPNIPKLFQKMYMNLLAKDGNTMTHSALFEKIKIKTEDSNPTSSSSESDQGDHSDSLNDAYDWGGDITSSDDLESFSRGHSPHKSVTRDIETVKLTDHNIAPDILIDSEPFSVVVDRPEKRKVEKNPTVEQINIKSPFETDDRYKYEVTRFLTNKN